MADVFISYSSKDRDHAATLAQALGDHGWSVWWDREILTGQAYDRAIERALDEARCVVVLWSAHAVQSEWVKNEAAAAAERNVLLPANLDGVKLPLEFRRKQTADLSGWSGDIGHPGFGALCRGIEGVLQGRDDTLPTPGPVPVPRPQPGSPKRLRLGIVVVLVVMAVVAGFQYARRDAAPDSASTAPSTASPPAVTGGATASPTTPASTADVSTAPQPTAATPAGPTGVDDDLAADVAGTYLGEVMSDSRGSSRSNITVKVERVDADTVHVSSTYARIDAMDIDLTKIGDQVMSADGDSPFIVDLSADPLTITYNPHNELAYAGRLKSR